MDVPFCFGNGVTRSRQEKVSMLDNKAKEGAGIAKFRICEQKYRIQKTISWIRNDSLLLTTSTRHMTGDATVAEWCRSMHCQSIEMKERTNSPTSLQDNISNACFLSTQ